jgi:hypothetical protein
VLDELGPTPDLRYRETCASSLLLFCWSKFARDDAGDLTLDYLAAFGSTWDFGEDEPTQDGDKPKEDWRVGLLREYPYVTTDELDNILIQFVDESFLNKPALRAHYKKYLEGEDRKEASLSVERAWQELFHGTLADTEHEFCEAVSAATLDAIGRISLHHVDAVLQVLDELGHVDKVAKLLERVREVRPQVPTAQQEWPHIGHRDLRTFIDEQRGTGVDNRTIGAVISEAIKAGEAFIAAHDRERLAAFSPQDYLEYFLNTPQPHLTSIIRHLYRATAIQNPDGFDRKMRDDLKVVCQTLARMNKINYVRMRNMGLLPSSFDPTSPAEP